MNWHSHGGICHLPLSLSHSSSSLPFSSSSCFLNIHPLPSLPPPPLQILPSYEHPPLPLHYLHDGIYQYRDWQLCTFWRFDLWWMQWRTFIDTISHGECDWSRLSCYDYVIPYCYSLGQIGGFKLRRSKGEGVMEGERKRNGFFLFSLNCFDSIMVCGS